MNSNGKLSLINEEGCSKMSNFEYDYGSQNETQNLFCTEIPNLSNPKKSSSFLRNVKNKNHMQTIKNKTQAQSSITLGS